MIEIPKIQIGENIPKTVSDFDKIHDENFVDIEEVLKPQPIALSIGESEYKGKIYPIAIGSFGDFSCIVAPSKARKTFLKSLILSTAKGGCSNHYTSNIKAHDMTGKYIIDIDTEQSKFHSQRAFRRVAELAGFNSQYYAPFSLRSLSPDERFAFIDWIFTKSKYVGKIGLVAIDGIADLVNDVNNLEVANATTQKLLEWSAKENCHIITILHRNFGTRKPTGHLGSSVLKKAETIISVDIEGEYSKVTAEYTRNQPFEEFLFGINKDGLPYVVGDAIGEKKLKEIQKEDDDIAF